MNVNECPNCSGVDLYQGRLVGDMISSMRVNECLTCGCEWTLYLGKGSVVVTVPFKTDTPPGEVRLPHRARVERSEFDRRLKDDGSCTMGRRLYSRRGSVIPVPIIGDPGS